jgi:hypothetical protein
MSLIQVGLVDKTKAIDPELMQAVAAALTIQVTRDLPQFWNVQATVTYEPNASKIPAGVWPAFLVDAAARRRRFPFRSAQPAVRQSDRLARER